MRLSIKVGGSLLYDDNGPAIAYLERLLPTLREIKNHHQLVLTVGGGRFVKNYEQRCLHFLPRERVEESDIHLLAANIVFFSNLLGLKALFSLDEITETTTGVLGGVAPGRSTDANAAFAAAAIKADVFIKLTNVDGVYDKDPNRFRDARLLQKITYADMRRVLKKENADDYLLLDAVAQRTITEHRIRTVIANGTDPGILSDIIAGKAIGTLISD